MWPIALVILAADPSFSELALSAEAVISSDGKAQTVLFPKGELPELPTGGSCAKAKSVWLVKGGTSLGGWINPEPRLVDALSEAKTWPEERMRAVGKEQLWKQERAAL